MGNRLIKYNRPDGAERFAIWSTVVDDILMYNATADEVVIWMIQEASDRAYREGMAWVQGERPGRRHFGLEDVEKWASTEGVHTGTEEEFEQRAREKADRILGQLCEDLRDDDGWHVKDGGEG